MSGSSSFDSSFWVSSVLVLFPPCCLSYWGRPEGVHDELVVWDAGGLHPSLLLVAWPASVLVGGLSWDSYVFNSLLLSLDRLIIAISGDTRTQSSDPGRR